MTARINKLESRRCEWAWRGKIARVFIFAIGKTATNSEKTAKNRKEAEKNRGKNIKTAKYSKKQQKAAENSKITAKTTKKQQKTSKKTLHTLHSSTFLFLVEFLWGEFSLRIRSRNHSNSLSKQTSRLVLKKSNLSWWISFQGCK